MKQEAFLIAVKQRREDTRVYAVLATSAAEAVAQVGAQAVDDAAIEFAGKLSKKMARSLKIAPGELRLI